MGSFSILNNISALNAQDQLNVNNVNLSRTLMRLSSGKRINSGADDAAGLQIADSLRANIYALNQAVRNANDGIGVAQIADGALQEISNLLIRSVTLAEEAATEAVDEAGRKSLNAEFAQIQEEIARIAEQTNFNGVKLFQDSDTVAGISGLGGSLEVFVGDLSGACSITVTVSKIDVTTDETTGAKTVKLGGTDLASVSLLDQDGAKTAFTSIKGAIDAVSQMRTEIGSGMSRLQSAVAVLQTQSKNTAAAESTIRDANFAEEIANLTKYQILAQSGMAALAQANMSAQSVLSLLQ